MKISYGITTHNEHEEIRKLLEFLVEHRDDGDEIVICDDHSDYQCWEVFDDFIHEQYPDIVFFERSLYNDFAAQKNAVIEKCTGDYIFHLDADELPHEILISQLKEVLAINETDLIYVPRVNTVDGITDKHIQAWGWKVTEKGWINYPDYQARVFRRDEKIRCRDQFMNLSVDVEPIHIYHHMKSYQFIITRKLKNKKNKTIFIWT